MTPARTAGDVQFFVVDYPDFKSVTTKDGKVAGIVVGGTRNETTIFDPSGSVREVKSETVPLLRFVEFTPATPRKK
jgi:hypothetical protein